MSEIERRRRRNNDDRSLTYLHIFEAQNVSGKGGIADRRFIFHAWEYDATFPGCGLIWAHIEYTRWDRIRLNCILWATGRRWCGWCGLIGCLRCLGYNWCGCCLNRWRFGEFFDQRISTVEMKKIDMIKMKFYWIQMGSGPELPDHFIWLSRHFTCLDHTRRDDQWLDPLVVQLALDVGLN